MSVVRRITRRGTAGVHAGRVRIRARARAGVAVGALATGTVLWAWLPAAGARAGTRPAFIVAVLSAIMTIGNLLADRSGPPTKRPYADILVAPVEAFARHAWASVRVLPWPQALTVAALVLEALHPARPWHTIVLSALLLSFLLALHLGDSAAGPAVLRPQLPLLAAGLALAALSAGEAALPAADTGSGWPLAVIAAVAALLVAVLALPI